MNMLFVLEILSSWIRETFKKVDMDRESRSGFVGVMFFCCLCRWYLIVATNFGTCLKMKDLVSPS